MARLKSKNTKSRKPTKKKPATKKAAPKKPQVKDKENYLDAYTEIVGVLQKYNLKKEDILLMYGHLGYTLGHAMSGLENSYPSGDELSKMYYEDPQVGLAMMIQGLQVKTWVDYLPKKDK